MLKTNCIPSGNGSHLGAAANIICVAVAVAERSGIDGVRLPRMRRRRVGLPSMPLSLPAAIVAAALLHGLLFATG